MRVVCGRRLDLSILTFVKLEHNTDVLIIEVQVIELIFAREAISTGKKVYFD